MNTGTAKNTAAAQQWLDSCSAVESWEETSSETITFAYDPTIEVSVVPHFIRFEA